MSHTIAHGPRKSFRAKGLALLIAGWLSALLALAAVAVELPALTGRVVDNANLIVPAARQKLVEQLEAFEAKSSDQIVVATVESLGGEAIEPFANRLFRFWQLGQAGENNGVLLLIAHSDRKMRIEVGYGLEGTLTDLHAKLVIENTLVPAFRAGDFTGGISRAVDDIIQVLSGNAAELEARAERNQKPQNGEDLIPALFMLLFFITFVLAIFAGVSDKSGGGGTSSSDSSGGGSSSSDFSGGGGSSGGGGASGSW